MNKYGLLLKQEVLSFTNTRMDYKVKNGDKTEVLSKLDMKFTWIDCETGEKDENFFGANGQNDFEKGFGSALTYAERYFILKQFNIPTDEDDPDAFQDKHMSEAEKKAKAELEKKAADEKKAAEFATIKATAIKEMKALTDIENVKATWAKYKMLQQDVDFIKAKDDMKTKLTPSATPA